MGETDLIVILKRTRLLYGENANFSLIIKLYDIYKCWLSASGSLGDMNLLSSIIRVSLEKYEKASGKATPWPLWLWPLLVSELEHGGLLSLSYDFECS